MKKYPKIKKFTFKKYQPEGQYRSFELGSTDIKLKRKVVGQIAERRSNYKWYVSFAVKKEATSQSPAEFKWETLIVPFDSEAEARSFLNEKIEKIIEKYDLYSFDN